MSFELQIQSTVLGAITARAVQTRLLTTCFAPIDSVYIDHADVASTPVAVMAVNAVVRLRVPVDVFVVQRKDVLSAPNALPVGATAPAGTVIIILEMTVTGTVIALRCVEVDLGVLGVAMGASSPAAKTALIEAVGSPLTSDLAPALKKLGLPTPTSSRIEINAGLVAIRFDPVGATVGHLFPGQDWGMFLDGASVEQLARSKMPAGLTSHITSLTVDAHWRPAGSMPHVDLDYAGKAPQVPDPFSGNVSGTLGCDFTLTPTITKLLRTTINWSLDIDLGEFVPGFIEDLVANTVAGFMDPTKFGGTPVGDHAFTLDNPLPEVVFGGARFGYSEVLASPAGMTIGGPVRLALDPGTETLQPSIHPFGLPYRLEFCSILARSGNGSPGKTVTLDEVTTNGSVWLEQLGAFCDVEIVSPGDWILPYVQRPAASPEIRIVIPSAVALGISGPVRLIVRTARGVRLIDLGTPPRVIVDASGHVTNALVNFIDDCLYIPVGPADPYGIDWGSGHGLDEAVLSPPLEHPDWSTYLGRQRGIDVQLVTLSALEPGELIQFRSGDHAIDITADRNGRALVPVLLPVSDRSQRASLIRVNRRSIAGHFSIRTAVLMNQVSFPAGTQHRLEATAEGTALLTTQFAQHVDLHEIGSLGAPVLLKREPIVAHKFHGQLSQAKTDYPATPAVAMITPPNDRDNAASSAVRHSHEEVELNPQPLPPHEKPDTTRNPLFTRRHILPGIKSLIAVPGFAESPLALALMTDGSTVVLDHDEAGNVRVAGTFIGPIGAMESSGNWASTADSERVSLYRIIRN